MINYSIIIPHYDIPQLLIRCIRSIPEREDVEIIVIDDNSPDGDKYQKMYPDLKRQGLTYIHLEKNVGGGGARNIGLQHAKGKWLIFVDADDFFNYCFNDVLNQYKDSSADIVFFNANSIDTNTYENTGRAVPVNQEIRFFIESKSEEAEYVLRYEFGVPWCKMIKRELVSKHKIQFEETPIHNDTQFSYLIGFYAKTIEADTRAAYCVTDRSGSVSRDLAPDKYLTRLMVFAKKYAFFNKEGIRFNEWRYIRSSLDYFQMNKLDKYLSKSKMILSDYGIDMQDQLDTIERDKKLNKRRVIKMKIIDRMNIELKRLLRFEGNYGQI